MRILEIMLKTTDVNHETYGQNWYSSIIERALAFGTNTFLMINQNFDFKICKDI